VKLGIIVDLANDIGRRGAQTPRAIGRVDFFETAQILVRREGDDLVEWTPVPTERFGDPSVDPRVQFLTADPQSHLSVWTVGTSLIFRDGFESGDSTGWS